MVGVAGDGDPLAVGELGVVGMVELLAPGIALGEELDFGGRTWRCIGGLAR